MGIVFKEHKEICIMCKTPTNDLYCPKCAEKQKNRDSWRKIKHAKVQEENTRFQNRPKPPRAGEIRVFKAN